MRQRRYFVALVEFLRGGNSASQKDVAEAAGVDPTLVSKWNRDSRFGEEIERLEHRHLTFAVERAHRGMLRAAEKGNPVAYQAVMQALERQGRVAVVTLPGDGGALEPGAGLGGTHVHIHAIPERQPMSALPPVLTLPAASVQTVSTPPAK